MGESTKIEWTTHTFNPWVGCIKVSAGCKNCYMYREQKAYGHDPAAVRRTSPENWKKPLKWNRDAAKRGVKEFVFTCSWSDFFIEQADPWRDEAMNLMYECKNLVWQVLTKRPERMYEYVSRSAFLSNDPIENIWWGVSVEDQRTAEERIPLLIDTPSAVRFVSAEPLLSSIDLRVSHPFQRANGHYRPLIDDIDWVIVGGESGPGARPFYLRSARDVIAQCKRANVACFVKQLGVWPAITAAEASAVKRKGGPGNWFLRLQDKKGGDWTEWPEDLRVHEFPLVAPDRGSDTDSEGTKTGAQ